MRTRSLWQDTRTFFPLFVAALAEREARRVAVVGASDGKFVLPLAELGYQVVAIERDRVAVDGGTVNCPRDGEQRQVMGLRRRLDAEGLVDRVTIVRQDLFALGSPPACDAVWTSCSWHYSANHHRPLKAFIDAMTAMLPAGGLFGAEYMMPVEPEHAGIEHYLDGGEIHLYLTAASFLWDAATEPFLEAPHLGQPAPHVHRMGFAVAQLAAPGRPGGRRG